MHYHTQYKYNSTTLVLVGYGSLAPLCVCCSTLQRTGVPYSVVLELLSSAILAVLPSLLCHGRAVAGTVMFECHVDTADYHVLSMHEF